MCSSIVVNCLFGTIGKLHHFGVVHGIALLPRASCAAAMPALFTTSVLLKCSDCCSLFFVAVIGLCWDIHHKLKRSDLVQGARERIDYLHCCSMSETFSWATLTIRFVRPSHPDRASTGWEYVQAFFNVFPPCVGSVSFGLHLAEDWKNNKHLQPSFVVFANLFVYLYGNALNEHMVAAAEVKRTIKKRMRARATDRTHERVPPRGEWLRVEQGPLERESVE